MTLDLASICKQAIPVIKECGGMIRLRRQQIHSLEINKKGVRDFVTEVDTQAERFLVQKLHGILPEAGFITEEKTTEQNRKEYNWIIDPLDGTMNYIHGIPLYSISVALQYHDITILGIVYEIVHDELFHTWQNERSYCNEVEIHATTCRDIKDALIVTGFPYIRTEERTKQLSLALKYFLDQGRDIRRLGTAATDLCYIACGRMDIYYEGFLNVWDIAAGILILQNAGGVVVNFNGETDFSSGNLVATNQHLLKPALAGVEMLKHL